MSQALIPMLKVLGRPLSLLFSAVVSARNTLFDKGYLQSRSFPVRIVSVGNISVGGTGKTPMVAHLVRELRGRGKTVAVVSRGYGGSYDVDAARVVPGGPQAAALFGDEPVWMAATLDIPVFVGRKRHQAVELCLKEFSPDIIIADDAFQHRWLKRDVDIVLLDAQDMIMEMLPAGRLREPLSAVQRADFVVLTKSNLVSNEELEEWVHRLKPFGFGFHLENLFRANYELARVVSHGGGRLISSDSVVLASAIAQPQAFENLVKSKHHVLNHITKPDHHLWSQADMDQLVRTAEKEGAAGIMVTEKDFVKLQKLQWGKMALHVAHLELSIEPEFPYAKLLK